MNLGTRCRGAGSGGRCRGAADGGGFAWAANDDELAGLLIQIST